MEETLTYDPAAAIIALVVVIAIFTLYIAVIVGIIRWIFRTNTIVKILTDQTAFLKDIKKLLEVRRRPQ